MFTVIITTALCITIATGQCITENDIITNDTSLDTLRNLIEGSTQFGLHLLKTINNHNLNNLETKGLFFSPFSVWSALMVAYMGAKGNTESEMKSLLGLGDSDKVSTWEAFHNLQSFDFQDSPYMFERPTSKPQDSYKMANKIFFQQGTEFKECMAKMFSREIEFLNFAEQPQESWRFINSWVENQTNNRIKDIVPKESITTWTKMVIANAIYFKEEWNNKFDVALTKRRRFTLQDRTEIYVAMMHNRGRFMYGKSEELQCYALELPYKGLAMSMVFLLPNNRYRGVDILANRLTPESLRNLMDDMYPREVRVAIPRINMEDSFDLTAVLYSMGFKNLMDKRKVDLSGFTGTPDYQVDAAYHKSFIELNEDGTEAAAATAIIESRMARPVAPVSFIADYPFVYLIRDNMSGAILFMGTVQKPDEYSGLPDEQQQYQETED